ncbi:MAG TPA: LpqB family beta-propeller domain-containing protein [Casimicrobiaceae bacterium]|nr:LpqB family beta-propeller domain-containing protein [Casimicrobiaceae bacterium]
MPDDRLPTPPPSAFRRDPPLSIGSFAVRAASNELVAGNGVIRLRPRLMDVLLRLAATPGAVVSRQQLLDDVWPRRAVADEVLSRAIGELRTVLGDDAREARYIETLPKVGYRLIAPVGAPPRDDPPQPSGGTAHAQDGAAATPTTTPAAPATPAIPATPAAPATSTTPAMPSSAGPRDTAAGIPPSSALGTYRRQLVAAIVVTCAIATFAVAWLREGGNRPSAATAGALAPRLNGAMQFSSDVEMELSPRFSPDGSKVAFVLGDYDHGSIVVQDVATRARTVLGNAGAAYLSPVWFPDGERLAYFRRQQDACAIVERSIAQDTEYVLVDCDRAPGPRFDLARDGRRLVYASFREGDVGLRVLDIASGRVSALTMPDKDAGVDSSPRISPDGTRVAFDRGLHGQTEVWMVPMDAPQKARATGSPRGLSLGLAWAGNDGPLLVASDWSGFRALHVLDIATGKSALAGARNAQFPDVGPHGEIVYESAAYQANLQLLDVDDPASPPHALWPSARYSNYPRYSPDGQRIVFLSNRDNTASIFVGTPGGEMHRVPLPTNHVFAQPHWSHDGRALYAVRGSADATDPIQQAVTIDPQSGRVDVLAALGDRVSEVRDTDDGETLYFGVVSGPVMQLWRAPAAQPAQRERLPLPLVDAFDLDGRTLAYSQPRVAQVTLCELPDLHCAPGSLPPLHRRRTSWALAPNALWLADSDGMSGELLRFDLARHEVTARLPYVPSAIGPNLAIAPDQRHAIISRAEPPAIDLMLAPAL